MIRVTVELWPGGDESCKTILASMDIINTGDHVEHPHRGNYLARFYSKTGIPLIRRDRRLEDWHRQTKSVWSLLHALLEKAGY